VNWRKIGSPSYTLLAVELERGESVTAEAGAFVYGRGDYDVKTHTGGLASAIRRRFLGGESMFLNTFTARTHTELGFASSFPGDVEHIRLNGDEWILQDGAFLAYSGDVKLSAAWRGLRGLIAEGELFWLKAEGYGDLWVESYGAIAKLELKPGERATIDNEHFVAMPSDVNMRVRKFGGWKSFLLGGEGFVIEVEGPAVVYIQTRILDPLVRILAKFLRKD